MRSNILFRALSSDASRAPDSNTLTFAHSAARYPAVSHLTIFITQNGGAPDGTQVYYLGFKGEFSKRAGRPGQIVYEAQANPADHAKLPGMSVGMHSNLGS